MKVRKKTDFVNYLIVYLVYAISGVSFFSSQKEVSIVIVILFAIIYFRRGKSIETDYLKIITFVSLITVAQMAIFGAGSIVNLMYLFIVISIPYFAIKSVGISFFKIFIQIAYFFGIISLIFYLFQSLSSTFYYFTSTIASTLGTDPNAIVNESFIIYTYESNKALGGLLLRNPGPFWEPSAMGAFTFLAFLYNFLATKTLRSRTSVIFILVLITTFSTAAYISLFAFFAVYFLGSTKRWWLIPVLLVPIYFSLIHFDFLGDKITDQMEIQLDDQYRGKSSGRFDGAYKSIVGFYRNPVFGRGIIMATTADKHSDEAGGYGFLAIAMRLGFFGFILYFMYFFRFWKRFAIIHGNSGRIGIMYGYTLLGVMFGISVYDTAAFLVILFAPMVLPELKQSTSLKKSDPIATI